jgi:hypothetical protein
MRDIMLKVCGVALLVLGGTSLWAAEKPQKGGKAEAASVSWLSDLDKAIEQVQETGKLLLIYNGWQREGT